MTHGLFTLVAEVGLVGLFGYFLARLCFELVHVYNLWKARQL